MKTIKILLVAGFCCSMSLHSFAQQQNTAQNEKPKAGLGFPVTQTQPEFPGGMDAMKEFLHNNLVYPKHMIDERIGGRVVIIFIVDKDGKIVDPTIMKGVHEELNAEALRLVKMMPAWKPASVGGTPVNRQYILPIDFVVPSSI